MNLIEQLAGYGECERLRKVPAASRFRIRGIEFTREELERAMLEHRRAHNIFEEGDYIIHDGELKVFAMWSNAIDGCAYIGYAYAEDGEMAHKDEFRHATDEEIEVEHRL